MIAREYARVTGSCDSCTTEFKIGDLVYCAIDPLYLTESTFDCGRFSKDIGIVTSIEFFYERRQTVRHFIICELGIYWGYSDTISYHLDKYIKKFR